MLNSFGLYRNWICEKTNWFNRFIKTHPVFELIPNKDTIILLKGQQPSLIESLQTNFSVSNEKRQKTSPENTVKSITLQPNTETWAEL
jgi:hypothetical protein